MSLILFYSKKCQNCEKLAKYIVQSNAGTLLKYVCIDEPNVRRNLPQNVRSVPTIFNPQTGETYSGTSAFKLIEHYFASQVRNSMQVNTQQQQGNRQQQSGNGQQQLGNRQQQLGGRQQQQIELPARIQQPKQPKQEKEEEDILPFSSEMCSGEECYSFIGQENPLERNFEFLNPNQAMKFSIDPMKVEESKGRQQPQQQQQSQPNFMELPRELQAMDIKKSKSGGDFQDKLERFQQERNTGMPQQLRRF
jgi:hypothetical protein